LHERRAARREAVPWAVIRAGRVNVGLDEAAVEHGYGEFTGVSLRLGSASDQHVAVA
jgi:hypothetical protein